MRLTFVTVHPVPYARRSLTGGSVHRSAKRSGRRAVRLAALLLAATAAAAAQSAAGPTQTGSPRGFARRSADLANRCYAIASQASAKFVAVAGASSYRATAARRRATPFFL